MLILIILFTVVNLFSFYKILTNVLLATRQKIGNILLCFLFPFVWNYFLISILKENGELIISTKNKRKKNTGMGGSIVTEERGTQM